MERCDREEFNENLIMPLSGLLLAFFALPLTDLSFSAATATNLGMCAVGAGFIIIQTWALETLMQSALSELTFVMPGGGRERVGYFQRLYAKAAWPMLLLPPTLALCGVPAKLLPFWGIQLAILSLLAPASLALTLRFPERRLIGKAILFLAYMLLPAFSLLPATGIQVLIAAPPVFALHIYLFRLVSNLLLQRAVVARAASVSDTPSPDTSGTAAGNAWSISFRLREWSDIIVQCPILVAFPTIILAIGNRADSMQERQEFLFSPLFLIATLTSGQCIVPYVLRPGCLLVRGRSAMRDEIFRRAVFAECSFILGVLCLGFVIKRLHGTPFSIDVTDVFVLQGVFWCVLLHPLQVIFALLSGKHWPAGLVFTALLPGIAMLGMESPLYPIPPAHTFDFVFLAYAIAAAGVWLLLWIVLHRRCLHGDINPISLRLPASHRRRQFSPISLVNITLLLLVCPSGYAVLHHRIRRDSAAIRELTADETRRLGTQALFVYRPDATITAADRLIELSNAAAGAERALLLHDAAVLRGEALLLQGHREEAKAKLAEAGTHITDSIFALGRRRFPDLALAQQLAFYGETAAVADYLAYFPKSMNLPDKDRMQRSLNYGFVPAIQP